MAASAQAGKVPGGRRAFGYTAAGKLHPKEAPIVRECVRRVLAGESVRSIAADLNRRGVKTSAGNPWHPGPLKAMLTGTRIVGQRTHHRVVVAQGQWPAIIDEATHRRLVATLAARTPAGRRGRTPWLLTGFLRCGKCGAPLVGQADASSDGATRRYVCRKAPGYSGCGALGIKAAPLEEILGDLATERLADVDARRQAGAGGQDDDAAELAELDRIAAERIEVSESGMSVAARAAEHAALDRRAADVEARIAAKVRQTAPLDFVAAEGFIGRPWSDLDVDERRIVLGALIDHVTVAPASTRGSTRFEAERVTANDRIAWKV